MGTRGGRKEDDGGKLGDNWRIMEGQLGDKWGTMGTYWRDKGGRRWGITGRQLGPTGANWGPTGGQWGPTGANGGQLGANWGPSAGRGEATGAKGGQLGGNGAIMGHKAGTRGDNSGGQGGVKARTAGRDDGGRTVGGGWQGRARPVPTGDGDGDLVHPLQLLEARPAGLGLQAQPVDAAGAGLEAGHHQVTLARGGGRGREEVGHRPPRPALLLVDVRGSVEPVELREPSLGPRPAQAVATGDVEAGARGHHQLLRSRHRVGAAGRGTWQGEENGPVGRVDAFGASRERGEPQGGAAGWPGPALSGH